MLAKELCEAFEKGFGAETRLDEYGGNWMEAWMGDLKYEGGVNSDGDILYSTMPEFSSGIINENITNWEGLYSDLKIEIEVHSEDGYQYLRVLNFNRQVPDKIDYLIRLIGVMFDTALQLSEEEMREKYLS